MPCLALHNGSCVVRSSGLNVEGKYKKRERGKWRKGSVRVWREREIRRDRGRKRGILRMQPAGYQVEGDRGECVSGS